MWVFLVTEIMFFGGLFMAYLVYRWANPSAFQEASAHLNKAWGGVNTVVLIVSSLTMAMAVRSAQISAKPKTQVMWLLGDDVLRHGVSRRQGRRVHRQVHAPPGTRVRISSGRDSIRKVRKSFTRSISA